MIPGYRPLPEDQVLLIGARDFDDLEYSRLESSEISHLKWDEIREVGVDKAMNPHLQRLSRKVDQVYLHVDMDVHDANLRKLGDAHKIISFYSRTELAIQNGITQPANSHSVKGMRSSPKKML